MPPPGNWRVWLILAGRGFGKTRTGAETVRWWAESGVRFMGLVGATAADVRDIMVEGESGILATAPNWNRPQYEPSKRRLTWPNGAMAITRSADEPERLRGPQYEKVWIDELAAWRYIQMAWDMVMFGLRLGDNPQAVVTTTPRPLPLIKALLKSPTSVVTTGSSFENIANLAPAFFDEIVAKYQGTHLGQQELYAAILDDMPGALWTRATLEANRVSTFPTLRRIVVAIDPAGTVSEESSETGIVVAGLGADGQGYVLDDLTVKASPAGWARQAIAGYNKFEADRIVGEVNNGGDMVENTIRTVRDERDRPIGKDVPFKQVRASRGKQTRAEPVSALYEQGKVHHVGVFGPLEDQLCSWTPGDESPDRLDALVWALTELMVKEEHAGMAKTKATGLWKDAGEREMLNAETQRGERHRGWRER